MSLWVLDGFVAAALDGTDNGNNHTDAIDPVDAVCFGVLRVLVPITLLLLGKILGGFMLMKSFWSVNYKSLFNILINTRRC